MYQGLTRELLDTRRYLAPSADAFWEWRNGGEVLAWRNFGTIAFRAEVVEVLRHVASRGLPHFDAIVLFLAGCRADMQIMVQLYLHNMRSGFMPRDDCDVQLNGITQTIEALKEIPPEYRTTLAGKILLAESIFEAAEVVESRETALAIVSGLENGLPEEWYGPTQCRGPGDAYSRLTSLAGAAHRMAPDRLALRQKTGLDQLPESKTAEMAPPESLRELLSRLENDKELGGVARLAKNLMAVLTLPRAMSEAQELPLGGVSDITNRGSLDRLLVSELAHDDLTFTVRIALSEALYLRREAPPKMPPERRMVLIDSGLRMWGLPRVFATAAALALSVSRDKQAETAVYRARGPHLDVVDLATREGLVSHLAALEHDAHPGAALPVFRRLAVEGETVRETVLITCNEVVADKAFQRLLRECEWPLLFVVTVSRSGDLRLVRRSPQGTKILREVHCPLEEILEPKPQIVPLVDRDCDPSLPAILRLKQFPLRLPHPIDPQRLWEGPDGSPLALTHDRCLVHWDRPGIAPRQISDSIPRGALQWHDPLPATQWIVTAVIGRLPQHDLHLVHADLEPGSCHTIRLRLQHVHPRAVAAHAGALFVIYAKHVEVFSVENGQPLCSQTLPHTMTWMRDRFFKDAHGAYALSFDGTAARFEQVCDAETYEKLQIVGLFDILGRDGPACVTAAGAIRLSYDLAPSSGQKGGPDMIFKSLMPRQAGGTYRLAAVSADGFRLVLMPVPAAPANPSRPSWLLDLRVTDPVAVRSDPVAALTSHLRARICNRTLRHKFESIYAEGGTLTLVPRGRKDTCRIAWDTANSRMCLVRTPIETIPNRIHFQQAAGPPGAGYRLTFAQWTDGSRAYLDSRGLLHLKSARREIPELTIVLAEGPLAGWSSNGQLFGPEYFTGDETGHEQAYLDFYNILWEFVAKVR